MSPVPQALVRMVLTEDRLAVFDDGEDCGGAVPSESSSGASSSEGKSKPAKSKNKRGGKDKDKSRGRDKEASSKKPRSRRATADEKFSSRYTHWKKMPVRVWESPLQC